MGFTIVGVSNEGSGLIEKHTLKMKVAYPIAKVKGKRTDDLYGVKGFPSSALLDHRGRVIWKGHPGNIRSSVIEQALEQAIYVHPLDGKAFKAINKRLAKKEYGNALKDIVKALAKTPDDAQLLAAQKTILGILLRSAEQAASLQADQEFGEAMAAHQFLVDAFKGHPAADEAKAAMKTLAKLPEAKDELAAWKKMAKGEAAQRAGEFEQATKLYKAIAKKFPGTKSGARAEAYVKRHP